MLTARIIPCLDVRDGRVVKGVRFQGLRDAGCPVESARRYDEMGADELVVLDVSATPEGRATSLKTIEAIRAVLSIPLTVGGGVRSVEDARRLLGAGADKVAMNSAAVAEPTLVNALNGQFGAQCTVVAIDAALKGPEEWEVVVHSGTNRTGRCAVDWAREVVQRGAGEILLTSWDRDGTREGYDLELLQAVTTAARVPVIASSGADHPGHMLEALQAGAHAVLAASIFHNQERTIREVKDVLARNGQEVRPC